jgi:predicted metalloprotease with PDZ domain
VELRRSFQVAVLCGFISVFALAADRKPGEDLLANAKPGWLGFGFDYRRSTGTSNDWLFVRFVVDGGPASVGGLRTQDAIVAINGKSLKFADDLDFLTFLATIKPKDRATLSVRRGSTSQTVVVVARDMPGDYLKRWKLNVGLAVQKRDEQDRAHIDAESLVVELTWCREHLQTWDWRLL